jgi:WD40 repeat protein/tetratricopeptide (TPR) repeat protein
MTDSHRSEAIAIYNEDSLNTLNRGITKSEGSFALILSRCNYASLRERIVQQLHNQCTVEVQELFLDQSDKTLYTTIEAKLGQEQPSALMVFGLESVKALDQVLVATNRVREEFRNFTFPLVLWVTDEVLQKLIRLAPDFHSWATIVEFAIGTDELIHFIQETTDEVFTKVLDAGTSLFLDNAALNLGIGSPRRTELESAYRELQSQGVSLNPELEASLEFVLGRDADDSLDESRQHYERSLAFWQHSDNLERRGCLLFFLGLWWRTYALGHRNEYEQACHRAKDYFQQSIEVFDQRHRLDLVAKFINALGDSLQRLKSWKELEATANKAWALHKSNLDLFKLARAYGFLAEVALAKSDSVKARELAQLALSLEKNAETAASMAVSVEESANLDWERSFHRGWYLFSLAKAYSSLGQVQDAINTLEGAKVQTKPQYDPELYIQILNELRSLYFQQGDYLKAFQIKQQRRSIEHQYGFRAFIGAGRLQPKQQVTNPALPHTKLQGIVAQEIAASGRQQDVNRLIERLSRDDYRLTVIHGQSGVGKSSLLQAGLIPALKQKPINTRDVLPVLQQTYTDWIGKLGECLADALVQTQYCVSSYADTSLPSPKGVPTLTCGFANMLEPVILDSTAAILKQLQHNAENNFLTVLILDQFEEFFFIYKDPNQRRNFYAFLRECLNIPFVKVILSMREDYISSLLEWTRFMNLDVIDNNTLDKHILFYFGNFSAEDTKLVIQNFTEQAHFHLEPALIEELVNDLAGELGEIRPIELQVVGAQLQTENITTLVRYRQVGPKSQLVKRFLEEVIHDCGFENEHAARLVLYLLTDENGTRPFRNKNELLASLSVLEESKNLDLVLEILVKSGLVLLEIPDERYQLVHDYLVTFIRQQHNLLSKLEKQKKELLLRQAEIARLRGERWFLGAAVAVGVIMAMRAFWVETQRRQVISSEIKTHAAYSEALLTVNKQLEALRESLIAGKQLQHATWAKTDTDIRAKVVTALKQTIDTTRERNRLEGHENIVVSISFSPDGKTLASASADKTIRLWQPNGKLKTTLKGHQGSVSDVSFSPDGKTIASASTDGVVKLWSTDGILLKTVKGHTDGVLSVRFSPDGQTIASTSADQTIKLWNRDGTLRATLTGHKESVSEVNFSPDGQMIASASWDKSVKLWSINGKLLKTLNGHSDRVLSISFSPDGQTLASASSDRTVKLWRIDGTLLKTLKGHDDRVFKVTFSPDGKTLASGSLDRTIKLWSRDGNLQTTLKGHQDWVYSVKFSPDGKTLASASSDRTVRLWSLNNATPKILTGHRGRVSNVSFSPDGQMIASASDDKTVKLWKRDGTMLHTLTGHKNGVWSVNFSPNGKMVASGSGDSTVRLWGLDGKLLKTLTGHDDSVLSVSFSPNGQIIASGSKDKTIKLWNRNGTLLKILNGHKDVVNWVSFSPDGQQIASASDDKTVKLWNLDGKELQTLTGHNNSVYSVAFSPDGKTLASASTDKTVKLWNLDGKELKTLNRHTDQVYSVSFSPNGQTLASASRDTTVKLWNSQGTLLLALKSHVGAVNWISFSPDGQFLASAGEDQTVIFWNLDNLDLEKLLVQGCDQVRDYLKTNPNVETSDRTLCDRITISVSQHR